MNAYKQALIDIYLKTKMMTDRQPLLPLGKKQVIQKVKSRISNIA